MDHSTQCDSKYTYCDNVHYPPCPTSMLLNQEQLVFAGQSYDISYGYGEAPVSVDPNFGRTQMIDSDVFGYTLILPEAPSATAITPSSLSSPSSVSDDGYDTVSISTAFSPSSEPQPDRVLSSFDGVLFYVHTPTLFKTFPDVFQRPGFSSLSDPLFRDNSFQLDASSDELNIILHALYGTSPAVHSPDCDTLIAAVDRMPKYNITPNKLIVPTNPIHELFLTFAPLKPLEVYALGAYHDIHSLAVSSSSYLLNYDLSTITDETAQRIGAVYLKKLMLLRMDRIRHFKTIILHPPHPHPATENCTFQDQRELTRMWALISAYLAWNTDSHLSTRTVNSILDSPDTLKCETCRQALQDKIRNVQVQWSAVKRTI